MSIELITILAAIVLVGLLIIPTKVEQTYILRGKVLTLKEIAELLCEDGVLITELENEMQMAYDHMPNSIPAVLKSLEEAEIPAKRFHNSIIVMRPLP